MTKRSNRMPPTMADAAEAERKEQEKAAELRDVIIKRFPYIIDEVMGDSGLVYLHDCVTCGACVKSRMIEDHHKYHVERGE